MKTIILSDSELGFLHCIFGWRHLLCPWHVLSGALLASGPWLSTAAAAPQAIGQVVAWGDNVTGQTNVPAGLEAAVAIAAGGMHNLALLQDGTVVAWGSNSFGESSVPANLSGVIAIEAGRFHSLALKGDGTVVAWGQFWDGKNEVPMRVPPGLSGVVAIAAGQDHDLAIKQDGTVVAWGRNEYGETNVPAGLGGVVAVAAGENHSLALKRDGVVVAWGEDNYGQGTGGRGGLKSISAGAVHNVALKQDGTVVAWGYDADGECRVPEGLSGVSAVAAGDFHCLALKQDGTVVAWGWNPTGQSTVPKGLTSVIAVSAGAWHNLALVRPLPGITAPPRTQTAEAGSTVELHVRAAGTAPLKYQWFFGGTTALAGATNSWLELANLQPAQAGAYTVVITNLYGAVSSPPASLSIIPPVPRRTVPVIRLRGVVETVLHLSFADTLATNEPWQELPPVTLSTNRPYYVDTSDPLPRNRFYRAWQPGSPDQALELQMSLATEIPLAGTSGTQVRIDSINAVGPTDAWGTLDTVVLTNPPQQYLDLNAFRQPNRLYRLVRGP